jgi:hypothetical protein
MKRQLLLPGCLCAISFAPIIEAKPIDAFWEEVPVIDDPGDSEDLTGFRSFDLFVTLEPGDVVFAQDFGIAGPNTGLSLGPGQDFFQHTFGSHIEQDAGIVSLFPDVVFDTRGQMGQLGVGEYQPLAPAWDPSGSSIAWFISTVDGVPIVPGEPDANGEYWFARITVNSVGSFEQPTAALGEFLGGQAFLSGTGPNGDFGMQDPSNGIVDIPNAFAIPTPGAATIIGGFALTQGRRQRRKQRGTPSPR